MKRMIASLGLVIAVLLFVMVSSSPLAQTFPSELAAVRLDWNPNGNVIALSNGDSTVTIIDAHTRAVLNTLPVMPFPVRALRWNDDGMRLAIGGDYSIRIWDNVWDGSQAALSLSLEVPLQLSPFSLANVDWNDSTQQILGVASTRAYIWDSQTGQLARTIEPFTTPIISAIWNPDGTRLASSDLTGYILIEESIAPADSGEDTRNFEAAFALAWNLDGTQLAVGTSGGFIEFSIGAGIHFGSSQFVTTDAPVFSLDWHPVLPLVASGNANGAVEIWNTDTGDLVQQVQTDAPVMSVAWSPDGTKLAFGTASSGLQIVEGPPVTPLSPAPQPSSRRTCPP